MRVLRASELGTYLYCARAWWYQRSGVPSENQAALSSGTNFHQQHARGVLLASFLRAAALFLLILACALFILKAAR
ncbi:MAG: hypothetical protein GX415_04920 [Chloroflexi bacterium]|jgi:hypothetical protein|nr:hypothetical protein [Anaerolineaceae bacterium]NLI44737.1 hypothetical protein [Chloroflexota bacterium]HOE34986.1 hypothetical protein [Anaerolineaceae bacterium]HOT25525.1 hypothetical protein [Anaerolineaceae bacterium]HQK03417.1 hypothetical protein [Anaerolineaceae bacterium]